MQSYPLLPSISEPRQRRVALLRPSLSPGEVWPVANLAGPRVITRLWLGPSCSLPGVVLRCYWDEDAAPSIELPVSDLLGGGVLDSQALGATANGGLALRLPMPFLRQARVEVANASTDTLQPDEPFAVHLDYDVHKPEELPHSPGMLHAQWNRETLSGAGPHNFCFARAQGQGAFVGAVLQVRPSFADVDWQELTGELHVIDGLGRTHALSGTRAADYFEGIAQQAEGHWSLRRFHLGAPLRFRSSLFSQVGVPAGDCRSIAFWYQHEPHRDFMTPLDTEALTPEARLSAGTRDLPPGPQETIEWLCGDGARKVVSRLSVLDLNEYRSASERFQDGEEVLWTTFHCPETRSGQLYVSYDDRVRITLNDRVVFERERTDGFGLDPVAVMIPAGENKIRIETTNTMNTNAHTWVIGFRIANSEGRTIEQMEFATYPAIPLRTA